MKSYNVIFFPDEPLEHGIELKNKLKEKYNCFNSSNLDEFDQVFQQSGRFLLVFMDVKKALIFMKSHGHEMNTLKYRTFAYMDKNGKFKPDSQKALDAERVEAFQKDEVAKLLKTIEDFFSIGNTSDNSLNVDDIQFIMPEDE
jgi:hypothetical protein